MQQSTDNWDILIIFMFSQKLDPVTSTKWEEHRNSITDNPTVTDFFNFLRSRADVLEMVSASFSEKPRRKMKNQTSLMINNTKHLLLLLVTIIML